MGLGAAQAHAESCNFRTSIGPVRADYEQTNNGGTNVRIYVRGKELNPGMNSCRFENSFRRQSLRCPFVIGRDARLEFYSSYFPRRTPPTKVSVVLWTGLSGDQPNVENVNGRCQ